MILQSEPSVHPHMLTSIFKNPVSLSGRTPRRANPAAPSVPKDQSSEPINNERSISVDSGLSMNQGFAMKVEVSVSVTTTTSIPAAPMEDYVQKTKKTAGYLRLLLHSRKCNGNCMKTACIKTSSVVDHLKGCFDTRCGYPGCTTSKKLFDHYEKCGINSATHEPSVRGPPGYANFCLLCSLVPQATTSPTNRVHYLSPDQSIYVSSSLDEHDRYGEIVYNEHRRSLEAMEDTHGESPIIFDEVMHFNKVPFQDAPSEYYRHSMTSSALESNYTEEPPRKIRSKSMNAMSTSELWTG